MLSGTFLRRVLPLALLAVSQAVSSGAGGAQSTPLKSGISLVSLDFIAIGKDGQPVPDLKAEEVWLKLGGRPRPLSAINGVDVGREARPSPAADGGHARAAGVTIDSAPRPPTRPAAPAAAITISPRNCARLDRCS